MRARRVGGDSVWEILSRVGKSGLPERLRRRWPRWQSWHSPCMRVALIAGFVRTHRGYRAGVRAGRRQPGDAVGRGPTAYRLPMGSHGGSPLPSAPSGRVTPAAAAQLPPTSRAAESQPVGPAGWRLPQSVPARRPALPTRGTPPWLRTHHLWLTRSRNLHRGAIRGRRSDVRHLGLLAERRPSPSPAP